MRLTQEHRNELERIRLDGGGFLSPDAVVREATKKRSPLHELFPWNDKEAAHIGRCAIARAIIQRVTVVINRPEGGPIRTRAYVSLEENKGTGYVHVETALNSQGGRDGMLRLALSDLASFRKKYAEVAELCNLFESIDDVLAA